MLGFVEIGKPVFGEKTSVLVDTSEEKLKQEFAEVERFYVPVHAVVRIDEVKKAGPVRVIEGGGGGSNVTPLPFRSEEHTSELQSLMRISYAVFCLKKKTQHSTIELYKQY